MSNSCLSRGSAHTKDQLGSSGVILEWTPTLPRLDGAPGSLLQGLGLCASQVLMVTHLWEKPLFWGVLGRQTPCYHLLPLFNLSEGHAGIPLSTAGAARSASYGSSGTFSCSLHPFSDDLWMARRDSDRLRGSCPSKTANFQGRPCPGRGATRQ